MKNREVYLRDPFEVALPNNGVATMTDARTGDERRTLRFELEHFVCEGQYSAGLVRILDSYVSNQGQPEQAAAWISGFFGSGKSHLAKMLRFLWIDYGFPEDGARARGLARLPDDVQDLLAEISTLGRRGVGVRAASGTLGTGAGDSVRLALLGIVFKSANLPVSYPQARFCLWLRRNGIYGQVGAAVEAQGRDFRRELNDLYVSPLIARALLDADPGFAPNEKEARAALRAQFPRPVDLTTEEFANGIEEALCVDGEMPSMLVVLDEVQQYIGEDVDRSFVVQEVVEACSKRFGDRLLFVGTGQTALSGTGALQRLQGRFTVNVELSDTDVETVTRRVVLAKRTDRIGDIQWVLDANAGEIDRHLVGTGIAPRSEDRSVLVDDYPLLPVRRRFWENALRAVDRAGTAGQLRTQLRIVYDANRHTADSPLGTVVPADFLFDEISANLLQSGVLLREHHETIVKQRDSTTDGVLKSRICALVFLIRELPRDPGVDIGVRATPEALADLLVVDLTRDGAALRARIPGLLAELSEAGTLSKLDDEYSLQTREGSAWEADFGVRRNRLMANVAAIGAKRAQFLGTAVQDAARPIRPVQGESKEPRKLTLHFGPEFPAEGGEDISVWMRDEWGDDEKSAVADARAAGQDSPVIHVFVPKSNSDGLARLIATQDAAVETLDFQGVPSTDGGRDARRGMETRRNEAAVNLSALVGGIVGNARVFQGGGNERMESTFALRLKEAADASIVRLFPEFGDADDHRWRRVIERARAGAENPFEVVGHVGKLEDHPVTSAVLTLVGPGKKGREIRNHFSKSPYGWPRDAIDAALIGLFGAGHLRAAVNGVPVPARGLDQATVPRADFRVESATVGTRQRLQLRKLFQTAGVDCKPNEEIAAAARLLERLRELAAGAGGDPPLPKRPPTSHLEEFRSLAGNEQLNGVLERHDEIVTNLRDWASLGELAAQRVPAFERLQALARHARRLDAGMDAMPQIEAIVRDRRLLDPSDPVHGLAAKLTDALRGAVTEAEQRFNETFDRERQRLEEAPSWQAIEQEARDGILEPLNEARVAKGRLGTEKEVLESLLRTSLDDWRTRTAALAQFYADARTKVDKLAEPSVRHLRLESPTLHTESDVRSWLEATERDLLERVRHGPVVIR